MEKEVIRFLTEPEYLEKLSLSKMLLNLMNTQVSGRGREEQVMYFFLIISKYNSPKKKKKKKKKT